LSSRELAGALGALKTTSVRTALAEALTGYIPLATRRRRHQTCVIGGTHDKVVPPHAVQRVADFHDTRAMMLPAGPHADDRKGMAGSGTCVRRSH
jgi:hypothetical protein